MTQHPPDTAEDVLRDVVAGDRREDDATVQAVLRDRPALGELLGRLRALATELDEAGAAQRALLTQVCGSGHGPVPPCDPEAELDTVRGVLAGHETATLRFDAHLRLVPRILAAQNTRIGSPLAAEELADVAQDAAVAVLRDLPSYTGQATLAGWIYRCCTRELLAAVRSPRSERVQALHFAWESERLQRAIERLGGFAAEVLRLRHFDELTFDAIARRHRMTPNRARVLYYRALQRLAELLGDQGGGS